VTFTIAWVGDGAARMEVARVDRDAHSITASGTQLGAVYELRYLLQPASLWVEVVGDRSIELDLDGADFFDLGWSPLFNSLPVIRGGLLEAGPPRDYSMRWVDVPSLDVKLSEQRYDPLGNGVVRFSSGGFTADIQFDEDGFVTRYPGIGSRVGAS
jgi:uncharacterized protein